MAVAVDVTGTNQHNTSAVTSLSYTGLTTSGSLPNGAVVALVTLFGGFSALPTGITATWAGSSATLVTSVTDAAATLFAGIFAILAPTTGAQTLALSWTNNCTVTVTALSLTGVNQTNIATAFAHANQFDDPGGGSTISVVISGGAVGDMVFAAGGLASTGTTGYNNTQIYNDTTIGGGGNRAAGAASVTMSFSQSTANNGCIAGIDVVAAAAAAGMIGSASGTGVATAVGTSTIDGAMLPDADSSTGAWINQSGGAALYSSIDEYLTPNDADYIVSGNNPSNDTCRVSLRDPTTTVTQPFNVSYRYGKSGSIQIDVTVALKQNITTIASWTHTNVPLTPITVTQTLTSPQFAAITDFTDLWLEFTANAP